MFILACTLIGCKAIEQKKTDRAVQRVIHNPPAFDYVGQVWERFHPCANDTIIERDTISQPIFIDAEIDVDSLRDILCDPSRPQPPRIIRVPVQCPPSTTEIRYVRDTRHEIILRDSLDDAIDRARRAEAQNAGIQDHNKNLQSQVIACDRAGRKAVTTRTLIMLIPIVLLLIIGYLFIKKR